MIVSVVEAPRSGLPNWVLCSRKRDGSGTVFLSFHHPIMRSVRAQKKKHETKKNDKDFFFWYKHILKKSFFFFLKFRCRIKKKKKPKAILWSDVFDPSPIIFQVLIIWKNEHPSPSKKDMWSFSIFKKNGYFPKCSQKMYCDVRFAVWGVQMADLTCGRVVDYFWKTQFRGAPSTPKGRWRIFWSVCARRKKKRNQKKRPRNILFFKYKNRLLKKTK